MAVIEFSHRDHLVGKGTSGAEGFKAVAPTRQFAEGGIEAEHGLRAVAATVVKQDDYAITGVIHNFLSDFVYGLRDPVFGAEVPRNQVKTMLRSPLPGGRAHGSIGRPQTGGTAIAKHLLGSSNRLIEFLAGEGGQILMVPGVIADGVPFIQHSLHCVWVVLGKGADDKKCSPSPVSCEHI